MDTKGYREAAGCIVIHVDAKDNDKILLLRRSVKETSQHGLWELPGGKLEKKQTPKEAALQETFEEAGIEFTGDPLVNPGVTLHIKRDCRVSSNSELELQKYK